MASTELQAEPVLIQYANDVKPGSMDNSSEAEEAALAKLFTNSLSPEIPPTTQSTHSSPSSHNSNSSGKSSGNKGYW